MLHNELQAKINKGKPFFFYIDEKTQEEKFYTHFGFIKGDSKWAKILEPGQFGAYTVDVYPDAEHTAHLIDTATELAEKTKELVEGLGKKVVGINPVVKEDDEGKQYFQFKRAEDKGKPKIYDVSGEEVTESWDKLIGNGSVVKVGYVLSPYYMATTKMVGVSYKFYGIQVIKLETYEGGGGNSGFGDESGDSAPFDSEEF